MDSSDWDDSHIIFIYNVQTIQNPTPERIDELFITETSSLSDFNVVFCFVCYMTVSDHCTIFMSWNSLDY